MVICESLHRQAGAASVNIFGIIKLLNPNEAIAAASVRKRCFMVLHNKANRRLVPPASSSSSNDNLSGNISAITEIFNANETSFTPVDNYIHQLEHVRDARMKTSAKHLIKHIRDEGRRLRCLN